MPDPGPVPAAFFLLINACDFDFFLANARCRKKPSSCTSSDLDNWKVVAANVVRGRRGQPETKVQCMMPNTSGAVSIGFPSRLNMMRDLSSKHRNGRLDILFLDTSSMARAVQL